jgi:hypothetical protein
MTMKKIALFMLIPALLFALPLAGKKKPAGEEKKPVQASLFIATQVAAVIDANAPQRLNRTDIPLTALPTLFLPAQQNYVYPVFLFQVKNADLNLAAAAETPDVLSAKFHVFTRLYKLENGALGAVVRERYIPFNLEEGKAEFHPEAVNYYSIAGEIFPAGNYLLALALSTPDFSRITVVFNEFSLPDVAQLQGKLDATPIFSVFGLKQLPAAETRLTIHRNAFVYNTLELSPKVSNEFKVGENLDLFFFILGAKPDANNAYSLQVTYRFKKEGKEVRKLGPVQAAGVIVSQPIALTFTEITKNAKGVETDRKELKMEPGEYTLEIELLDTVSKAAALKEFKFRIVL